MTPTDFKGVTNWVFDLDNTLYPAHSNLFDQIDKKISSYVQKLTGKNPVDARKLQKDYYKTYGTTLRGLMMEHQIEPDDFLEYVHDIDHSCLQVDDALSDAIQRLPGKRYILTNGTRKHAEAVAGKLGITHHFDDIFGIVEADLIPKPAMETYSKFLELNSIDPKQAAMFEDLSRNLIAPDKLGMRTVLVVPQGTREVFREAWEMEGENQPYVHHVTDNLGSFLQQVLREL
ncbi:pyrimidine 5'-nucleotidase [Rhodobacteraceae bacterium RKSG542]|uniref:pyrimidine 5'-nucleotidase n=1 Tax=Pseudovibrio flavus TaxID=2529854 RepID=UPI0012BCE5A4|nr:pyrimidine 5'-nucleotidase [Pseudovibrio flavus]MTI17157.1 pyrimidine 5'-nucleotidase [Pseudovibrio flavus]